MTTTTTTMTTTANENATTDLRQPLLDVSVARGRILQACTALPAERCALTDLALRGEVRRLSSTARSRRALPPETNSAMDGYAVGVDSAGGAAAGTVQRRVVATSLAGHGASVVVGAGEVVAITTGAPIPPGAVAVVMREQCDEGQRGDGVVTINVQPKPGENIRVRGEDVDVDGVVGEAGDALTPARLNLLWSAGHVAVDVVRLPTVAILASGDELRDVGSPYTDAHVINSNAWAIAAACRRLGCAVRMLGIAADTLADHVDKMAVDDVDVLITIGGVSMGSHDFVRPALEALGATLSVWKLAMRPGKPLAFGTLPRPRRPVLFFGLPGNPVSSLVTFELFVQPALRVLAGATRDEVDAPRERGILVDAAPFKKKRGLAFFARATHQRRADGVVEVQTVDRQGSGQVSGLANASALVCFGVDDEVVAPGSPVEFIALER